MYVPRKQRVRGLTQLEEVCAAESTKLVEYVDRKEDPLIQIVIMHQRNINSTLLQTARHIKSEVQRGTRQIKDSTAEKTKEDGERRMCGQLPRNLDENLVDNEQSYRWLISGDVKGETENTTVAAQNQAISTKYFKSKILKEETDSKCRLCKQHEDIDHLTSDNT